MTSFINQNFLNRGYNVMPMKMCSVFKIVLLTVLCLFSISLCSRQYCYSSESIPTIEVEHLFDLDADFLYPCDVTVNPDGQIYVVDGISNSVKIFDKNGKYRTSFGSKGSGKGNFLNPLGITCDVSGQIYVADAGNHRVQIFDADGRFLRQLRLTAGDKERIPDPADVAVDETRDLLYVIDNDNHKIRVYSKKTLQLLDQWGKRGENPGEFQFPFLAATDKKGTLYVVDVLNTRVQVLNSDGRTLAFVGKWGVDRGQMYRPKGVAIDAQDRIYVSDSYLGVIQVFNKNKKFKGVLGDTFGFMAKFKSPTGIYVDGNMRLYVVEMLAHKVSVYKIKQ
jgi:DNA-binding beta-propeller fold protein YncE